MFNISKEVEETTWVNYSEDEKYLVCWLSPDKIQKFSDAKGELVNVSGLIDYIVRDWDGIYETKNGKEKKLECNLEMKTLVFDKSPSRWGFVISKAINYNTFFDIKGFEKNS